MVKRKVEHWEISEYSKKEDCKFLNVKLKNVKYEVIEAKYKFENGVLFYIKDQYVFWVPQEIFETGGFSSGIVNGKYQEFNIYY